MNDISILGYSIIIENHGLFIVGLLLLVGIYIGIGIGAVMLENYFYPYKVDDITDLASARSLILLWPYHIMISITRFLIERHRAKVYRKYKSGSLRLTHFLNALPTQKKHDAKKELETLKIKKAEAEKLMRTGIQVSTYDDPYEDYSESFTVLNYQLLAEDTSAAYLLPLATGVNTFIPFATHTHTITPEEHQSDPPLLASEDLEVF